MLISNIMSVFSCVVCGAQYTGSDQAPSTFLICSDERQYVGQEGQKWATRQDLMQRYKNVMQEVEPGVYSVNVEPKLCIGQQVPSICNRNWLSACRSCSRSV